MVEAFSGMPAAITWIEKRWNNSTLGGCKHVHRLSNFEYPGIAPFLSQYFPFVFTNGVKLIIVISTILQDSC